MKDGERAAASAPCRFEKVVGYREGSFLVGKDIQLESHCLRKKSKRKLFGNITSNSSAADTELSFSFQVKPARLGAKRGEILGMETVGREEHASHRFLGEGGAGHLIHPQILKIKMPQKENSSA